MLQPLHQMLDLSSDSENDHSKSIPGVVNCALCRLKKHPHFRGRSGSIQLDFHQGTIILSGRLPSFYLKQLLQVALRDIDGVDKIDNRVDVVCSTGRSSTAWQ